MRVIIHDAVKAGDLRALGVDGGLVAQYQKFWLPVLAGITNTT